MFKHQSKTNFIIMKNTITIFSSIVAFIVLVAFTPAIESDGFYRVNSEKSSIKWVGTKVTGKTHEGTVKVIEGGIQLSGDAITAGKFTIDMTSINVTDLDGSMKEKLESHLKNDDFFSVDKFKTANLAITSVDGNNVSADLTIKGITNEISFPAKVVIDNNGVLTASADIEIDRSKYDVRYGSDSFFDNLGDKAIDNTLKFSVVLVASK